MGHKKNYARCRKNYIRHNSNYIRPFLQTYNTLKNKLLWRITLLGIFPAASLLRQLDMSWNGTGQLYIFTVSYPCLKYCKGSFLYVFLLQIKIFVFLKSV